MREKMIRLLAKIAGVATFAALLLMLHITANAQCGGAFDAAGYVGALAPEQGEIGASVVVNSERSSLFTHERRRR